jgi:hypothetical protein
MRYLNYKVILYTVHMWNYLICLRNLDVEERKREREKEKREREYEREYEREKEREKNIFFSSVSF